MSFSILVLVTCFKAGGGAQLGLTMSQGATRTKSLGLKKKFEKTA